MFIRCIGQGAKFILVLVGLALIFKKQIGDIADGIFTSIKTQVGKF